jgi:hypothetical protein
MRHRIRATEMTGPINPRGHLFDEGGQRFPSRIELPRKSASKRTWRLFARRFLPRLKSYGDYAGGGTEKIKTIESHL